MLRYTFRSALWAVPTLLIIALILFALLELAPGDPMAQLPPTIPAETRDAMRVALGLGEPAPVRFANWLWQFWVIEPLAFGDALFGTDWARGTTRVLSWQTRAPVMDLVADRLPQTLWVVGLAYVLGIALALPIGLLSACRQHSVFDQLGTFIAVAGYTVPPFFSGVLAILLFSVGLDWFPSIYDTTHLVTDWDSLMFQIKQMALPVLVLSVQTTAQISRHLRAALLDEMRTGYVDTARAKGLGESAVIGRHVLRNALLPVITIIALGAPQVFAGAVITEQIFQVNGLGQLLISAIEANDLPLVQSVTFMLAVLIVATNILADLLYTLLDPRVTYD